MLLLVLLRRRWWEVFDEREQEEEGEEEVYEEGVGMYAGAVRWMGSAELGCGRERSCSYQC